MKTNLDKIAVNGGWVKRDAKTGRFVEVQTSKGVRRASAHSRSVVSIASAKRHEALKRLSNR